MRYDHTQYGPWFLLLAGFGLLMLFTVAGMPTIPLKIVMATAGGFMVLLSLAFRKLTVRDEVDRLRIQFGPLPLLGRSIPYAEMEHAERGRTTLLDGWGIHVSPRGGWTWNLWGYDCVTVHLTRGRRVHVGTDDPTGLEAFLASKIGSGSGAGKAGS